MEGSIVIQQVLKEAWQKVIEDPHCKQMFASVLSNHFSSQTFTQKNNKRQNLGQNQQNARQSTHPLQRKYKKDQNSEQLIFYYENQIADLVSAHERQLRQIGSQTSSQKSVLMGQLQRFSRNEDQIKNQLEQQRKSVQALQEERLILNQKLHNCQIVFMQQQKYIEQLVNAYQTLNQEKSASQHELANLVIMLEHELQARRKQNGREKERELCLEESLTKARQKQRKLQIQIQSLKQKYDELGKEKQRLEEQKKNFLQIFKKNRTAFENLNNQIYNLRLQNKSLLNYIDSQFQELFLELPVKLQSLVSKLKHSYEESQDKFQDFLELYHEQRDVQNHKMKLLQREKECLSRQLKQLKQQCKQR